jgi:hypothetical protein
MRRFKFEYSVCDFETEKEFRGADLFEAEKRFLRLVVDLGGLERGDIDYYQITELAEETA